MQYVNLTTYCDTKQGMIWFRPSIFLVHPLPQPRTLPRQKGRQHSNDLATPSETFFPAHSRERGLLHLIRYVHLLHVCWSDLNYSRATMHNQPTAVIPEITMDIPPQDSTHGADPGDTALQRDKGQPSVPLAVCKYMVECTSSAHRLHQVSDDDKPTQTILQDAQKNIGYQSLPWSHRNRHQCDRPCEYCDDHLRYHQCHISSTPENLQYCRQWHC